MPNCHRNIAARRGVSAAAVAAALVAMPAAAQTLGGTVVAGTLPGGSVAGTPQTVVSAVTPVASAAGAVGAAAPASVAGVTGTVGGVIAVPGTVAGNAGTAAPAGSGTGVTGTVGSVVATPGAVVTGTGNAAATGAATTSPVSVVTGATGTIGGAVTTPAAGTGGTGAVTGTLANVTGAIAGAVTITGADGTVASATPATVSAADSIALGSGSIAARGGQTAYVAARLAAPQTSAGEVSVGLAGLERQITNVAAGSAPTDAVNVAQLQALGYDVDNLAQMAVRYDSAGLGRVALGTVGQATNLANVAAGQIAAGSTDAVNGGQLFAVDAQVTVNASDIANLRDQLASLTVSVGGGTGGTGGSVVIGGGGTPSPAQYSNAATPTTPNGGTVTNDVTMVGANGGPVAVHNVAAGQIAAGSTDAVNGGQLYATNQAVATAQGDATAALAMGRNSVQYDNSDHTSVTLGDGSAPVTIHNVAPGVSPTDAVNVAQLNASSSATLGAAKDYTDAKVAALDYDLDRARRDANGGTTSALAAAALPQPYEAGKGMLALAGGTYRGEAAFAIGASKAFVDGHTVLKMGATYGTHASVGASAGLGYQF